MIKRTTIFALFGFLLFGAMAVTAQARDTSVSWQSLWSESYDLSRDRFLQETQDFAGDTTGRKAGAIAVPSKTDTDLTVDWWFLPATKEQRNLVIVSSGVHGVEGYVGAAMQNLMLKHVIPHQDRSQVAYLFLHAVNPWGFRHGRRVTENNVDLNRNMSLKNELYETGNSAYDQLQEFLNPKEPVDLSIAGHSVFAARLVSLSARYGSSFVRQATLGGQYRHRHGIYFGGDKREPQLDGLQSLLLKTMEPYRNVLHVDFHTGYGRRAHLHLIANKPRDLESKKVRKAVFFDYPLDVATDDDSFYQVSGDMTVYLEELVPVEKTANAICFEYGTIGNVGTLGTFGSISSLRRMVLENQGSHHGYASESDREVISRRIAELYNPSDESYRQTIVERTMAQLPLFLERFAGQ